MPNNHPPYAELHKTAELMRPDYAEEAEAEVRMNLFELLVKDR